MTKKGIYLTLALENIENNRKQGQMMQKPKGNPPLIFNGVEPLGIRVV